MDSYKKAAFVEETLKRILPKHFRVSVAQHANLYESYPKDSGWHALISTQVACGIPFTSYEWQNLEPEIVEAKAIKVLGEFSSVDCTKSPKD